MSKNYSSGCFCSSFNKEFVTPLYRKWVALVPRVERQRRGVDQCKRTLLDDPRFDGRPAARSGAGDSQVFSTISHRVKPLQRLKAHSNIARAVLGVVLEHGSLRHDNELSPGVSGEFERQRWLRLRPGRVLDSAGVRRHAGTYIEKELSPTIRRKNIGQVTKQLQGVQPPC